MLNFPIILYPKPIEEFLKSVEAKTDFLVPLPDAPTLKNAASLPHVNEVSPFPLLKVGLLGNFILLIGMT